MDPTIVIEVYSQRSKLVESRKTRANPKFDINTMKDGSFTIFVKTNFNTDIFVVKEIDSVSTHMDEGKLMLHLPEYKLRLFLSGFLPDMLRSLLSTLTNKENMKPHFGNVAVVKENQQPKVLKTTESYFMKHILDNIEAKGLLTTPTKTEKRNVEVCIKKQSPAKALFRSASGNSGCTPIKKKINVQISPHKRIDEKEVVQKKTVLQNAPQLTKSKEQQQIIDGSLSGENIFYTGGAGTGKSCLLMQIVDELTRKHGTSRVFVTATTGLAACAVGGMTVHQFAGIPAIRDDSDDSLSDIASQALKNTNTVRRWRQASVLIIDEISMLSPRLLEVLYSYSIFSLGSDVLLCISVFYL